MASQAKLREKFEDLNVTTDELQRISKALKDEEFRKLFTEYAEEISDPENRKLYESEIQQLERQNGMDIKFINPEPGYVLKTSVDGNTKAFINVCKNDNVGKPSSRKEKGPNGHYGIAWSIPHSFAPVREDMDKNGHKCKVFDFVIHPDTYRMAESNARFKDMINDTAMDGIERQFNMKIDKKNVKYPKMKFKGTVAPTVVRTKIEGAKKEERPADDILGKIPYPYDDIPTEEKTRMREKKMKEEREKSAKQKPTDDNDGYTKPVFSMKHRCEFDIQNFREAADARPSTRPKELVIDINLPLLNSAAPVNLDIFEKSLKLECSKPAKYRLHLDLPYPVDESEGSAKFNKSKHSLTVTLPVVPAVIPELPFSSGPTSKPTNSQSANDDVPQDENKPLIEVISSQDSGETSPGPDRTDESSTQAVSDPHCDNITCKESQHKSWPLSDDHVPRDVPKYDYHQDDEMVSFVLQVKNISRESIEKAFSPDHTCCHLRFSSIGSGCFPVQYSFYVAFPVQCRVESIQCRVEVSDTNAVLILVKQDESIGLWDSFCAGLGAEKLEEKTFATKNNVRRLLDSLDADTDIKKDSDTKLEVTHMTDDKLTILVKEGDHLQTGYSSDSIESTTSSQSQDPQRPKLHGILRQRSHTICETGSEPLTSGLRRQSSEGSGQLESDETSETSSGSRRRRSVSFSEYVERTTFKTGQTVSSMRSTLKSKRRRARKREQKQAVRQLRRRRSSSGSEVSSDERSSSSGRCHKAASTQKHNDDGVSSEVTTESESRDTDDHLSDDDTDEEDECFEEDSSTGAERNNSTDDAKLDSSMKDMKLEDVTVDTVSLTKTHVHLEVTAGPVTDVTSGPPVAVTSGPPPARSSAVSLGDNAPEASENYLNGDAGNMLSNIVKEINVDSVEMGGEEGTKPEGGEEGTKPEGGEEGTKPEGGEEGTKPGEEENSVAEGKKVELIQEVCETGGNVVNGEVTAKEEGSKGEKGTSEYTPDTMLSWDDTPAVTDTVDSPVTLSNSLMYDLDDD